jgi:acetyl-CoA carboxylase, biotin carboxylase subunit
MNIKKILIANRGEIAVRVIRTCREMGIKSVAVYSEADRKALYVSMADEAYLIGPAPSNESYLCIDKIIDAAKKSKADAVHPGYGFLSEKAEFSQACVDAGLAFLGPTPNAITSMGDKVTARGFAKKAKVPMVPGTLEPVSDFKKIKKLAGEFGYPVLLKAASGGGGKGMRVVEKESDVESAYQLAANEALKSFGDDRIYLEKYVKNPRHVEIQIIRDTHGNGFFLLERECSMQRRHQKVIEEAPCSYLKKEVRDQMGAAALGLADAIDYHGVGTVEFLVDDDQDFYFLEMNTRLQVEHTVTEMITGLDLVRLQIEVAQGEALKLKQENIIANGHAIECRIYAEDPSQNFMPSPGKIKYLKVPEGPGIRHDSGVYQGSEISIYYDPMVAKLIVHTDSREHAIQKMLCALSEYQIGGLTDNVEYLKTLLKTEVFQQATMHTQYIDTHPELAELKTVDVPLVVVLGTAAYHALEASPETMQVDEETSNWLKQGIVDSLM